MAIVIERTAKYGIIVPDSAVPEALESGFSLVGKVGSCKESWQSLRLSLPEP